MLYCALAGGQGAWAEWPQVQHDPAHTGYTPEEVPPPYKVAWYHNFQPERIGRHIQAISHKGAVIVPTEMGNVYALAAADGKELWKVSLGSPIEQSAGCADGLAIVGTLDGRVCALRIQNKGEPAWTFRPKERFASFTASPCIIDGLVFMPSRQGILYALKLADGKVAWQRDFGVPIQQSAAAADGKVYLGGEDMKLRAFRVADGEPVWTSDKLYGQSFVYYHPVVIGDKVLVRPMAAHPSRRYYDSNWGTDPDKEPDRIFQATWDHREYWMGNTQTDTAKPDVQTPWGHYYNEMAADVKAGRMPERLVKAQDAVVEHYKQARYDQTLFVLNASDGKQAYVAAHFQCLCLPGPQPPPASAGDGTVVIPWIYVSHVWARMDLKTGRAVEIMLTPGGSNGDETLNASVGGRYFFDMHCEEANAAYTGIFNFRTKTWARLPSIPGRWGQLSDNTESGGAAASIADGNVYHFVFHQLAAFTTDRTGGQEGS